MTKFEYLRVVLSVDKSGVEKLEFISETPLYAVLEGESTDQVLNALGERRWELVSSYFQPFAALVTLTFKRIKNEARPRAARVGESR